MKLLQKMNVHKVVKALMIVGVMMLQFALVNQYGMTAYAQGTAVVSAESGKIRAKADTSSSVMASVKSGDKLDVISQTTDASGYTWNKVYVDGSSTGYIRADLVKDVTGSISTESASNAEPADDDEKDEEESSSSSESDSQTSNQSNTQTNTTTTTVVTVNPSNAVSAKVTGSSVRVRETPSTSGNIKGNASGGTVVTVSGEAVDKNGATWYQISFNSGNSTINGFIRSDFLEVTQTLEEEPAQEEPTQEEPVEEEPVEETPVNRDYEVKYEANSEGVEEWFLYDHQKGTKQSITNLYAVLSQTQESEASAKSQVKTLKMVMIIMAVAIVGLIVGLTLVLFKMRDSYDDYDDDYEDDEDYEDEEYEDEEYEDEEYEDEEYEDEEEVYEAPVKPRRSNPAPSAPARPAQRERAKAPVSKDSDWQPKNFLDIDDDMEFEFLDIR